MAYFCLTLLKNRARGKKREKLNNAAKKYAIQPDVLKKLGKLSSEKGDEETARKVSSSNLDALTIKEIAWINAVIKMFIRRIGEYEYDPTASLSMIKMADLPPLY
jgi:hypothetical protein